MRNVPVVSYPVNPSRFQVGSKWGLLLLSMSVQLAWWASDPNPGRAPIVALLTDVLLACLVGYQTFHPVCGVLQWTGETWLWESGKRSLEGQVIARVDLQSRVLLEFRAPGYWPIWLWLEAGEDPRQWESFRRALWSLVSDAGLSDSLQSSAS